MNEIDHLRAIHQRLHRVRAAVQEQIDRPQTVIDPVRLLELLNWASTGEVRASTEEEENVRVAGYHAAQRRRQLGIACLLVPPPSAAAPPPAPAPPAEGALVRRAREQDKDFANRVAAAIGSRSNFGRIGTFRLTGGCLDDWAEHVSFVLKSEPGGAPLHTPRHRKGCPCAPFTLKGEERGDEAYEAAETVRRAAVRPHMERLRATWEISPANRARAGQRLSRDEIENEIFCTGGCGAVLTETIAPCARCTDHAETDLRREASERADPTARCRGIGGQL